LTTAALLLKAGQRVTVLEAHVYPGGSAGTFFHKRYLFDAGATLAGGFSPGEPHHLIGQLLELEWPVKPVDPAWIVHLPDGRMITQWTDSRRWRQEVREHFPETEAFWNQQEALAEIGWQLASPQGSGATPLPWPPQSAVDYQKLAKSFRPSLLKALPYINRSVGAMTKSVDPVFRTFLDAQLLISAQAGANRANAIYGSAALDLPRRGVNYVNGGMGSLAKTLVSWIRDNGGEVLYRQKVDHIEVKRGRARSVRTEKGGTFTADNIIANVTPWALVNLLGTAAPTNLKRALSRKGVTWGAFTLYLGLDKSALGEVNATHHQVIADYARPLGEGNSVFISLADSDDSVRGPEGHLPATLSTHTKVAPWWQLYNTDKDAYYKQRRVYIEEMQAAAERAVPGLKQATRLTLPGTPIDFEYFTRRPMGLVGGFPQTSLFSSMGSRTGISNLFMVGDSVFPGQSTAAVTLGAMRVSDQILRRTESFSIPLPHATSPIFASD
jgi:C-3',4' desaturase CrtD